MALHELTIRGGSPGRAPGSDCVLFAEAAPALVPQGDLNLLDGSLELELSVTGERAFPGIAWRVSGDAYESFFIRPHQVGNPDACQYSPVFNGVSAWQLYHGAGFWAPIEFPIGRWFALRVSFAGDRGEAYVGDMNTPAIVFSRLRAPVVAGSVGILPGGPGVHVARFSYDSAPPALRGRPPLKDEPAADIVPGWWVSNLVTEGSPPATARDWTYLESAAGGLADLARVHPLGQTPEHSFCAHDRACGQGADPRSLDLGFSDRAVLYLNGRLFFAATTRTARATTASWAPSAGTTPSTCRSWPVTTSWSWRSRRHSAAGASRPASAIRRDLVWPGR